jgi:hypothetical protein
MADTAGKWFKGCAIGCGGLLITGVLLIVGMSLAMRSAFDEARHDRDLLAQRHGETKAFVPPVDGTIPDGRIEAFLEVRRALAPVRAEIEDVDGEMADFEELAGDGEEPELAVALPAIFRLTKSMMGLPFVFGEIERIRNQALVEVGMGLGEYAYIYMAAYHDQLVGPDTETHLFTGSAANRRVRSELAAMLRRQYEAAATLPGTDPRWVRTLEIEVATLEADNGRLPWQDGLPTQMTACLAPYREALDATYSAATAEFDLLNSTVRNGGLTIEMN